MDDQRDPDGDALQVTIPSLMASSSDREWGTDIADPSTSELLHGAESPDSAGGISASTLSALSAASRQQTADSRV